MKCLNTTVLLTATFLTGCVGIGQSEFNCSGGDTNALCASTRTIYNASNGELAENDKITYVEDGEVYQTTVSELDELKNSKGENATGKEPSEQLISTVQSKTDIPLQFSYDGNVLRQDVKVMRIWLAPWIDKSDTLHLSKLIYTDIEKRKWEIGENYQNSAGVDVTPFLSTSTSKESDEGQITGDNNAQNVSIVERRQGK